MINPVKKMQKFNFLNLYKLNKNNVSYKKRCKKTDKNENYWEFFLNA